MRAHTQTQHQNTHTYYQSWHRYDSMYWESCWGPLVRRRLEQELNDRKSQRDRVCPRNPTHTPAECHPLRREEEEKKSAEGQTTKWQRGREEREAKESARRERESHTFHYKGRRIPSEYGHNRINLHPNSLEILHFVLGITHFPTGSLAASIDFSTLFKRK